MESIILKRGRNQFTELNSGQFSFSKSVKIEQDQVPILWRNLARLYTDHGMKKDIFLGYSEDLWKTVVWSGLIPPSPPFPVLANYIFRAEDSRNFEIGEAPRKTIPPIREDRFTTNRTRVLTSVEPSDQHDQALDARIDGTDLQLDVVLLTLGVSYQVDRASVVCQKPPRNV